MSTDGSPRAGPSNEQEGERSTAGSPRVQTPERLPKEERIRESWKKWYRNKRSTSEGRAEYIHTKKMQREEKKRKERERKERERKEREEEREEWLKVIKARTEMKARQGDKGTQEVKAASDPKSDH
jgi:hypothetical protein